MSRRSQALIAGTVVLAGAIAAFLLISSDSPQQNTVELPTFTATPPPHPYASIADLAADLEEAGMPCGELEYQAMDQPGQRSIQEFATCYIEGDRGLNMELWLFETAENRDKWADAFKMAGLVVVGPNWLVTPQDQARADAVLGALGGRLIGAIPTS